MRLAPCEDENRLAAVRFAFKRFASADLSVRSLVGELHVKGFPAPGASGWTHGAVRKMLRNPIYCGGTRWNAESSAKYHALQGGEVIPVNGGNGTAWRYNDDGDVIVKSGTHQGIVSRKLFERVQKRLAAGAKRPRARRAEFPLAGLVFCSHCGQPMHGSTAKRVSRHGREHRYRRYVCQSYSNGKHRNTAGCGHFTLPAERVARWLAGALQAEFGPDGPGRAELVTAIKRQLRAGTKTSKADVRRLTARLADLDQQVARLVQAIRTTDGDVPELAHELVAVRREREAVQEALRHAGRHQAPSDLEVEADAIADELGRLVGSLDDGDPATIRRVFGLLVSRIICRWERTTCRSGRQRCKLVAGEVELEPVVGLPGVDPLLSGGVTYARP